MRNVKPDLNIITHFNFDFTLLLFPDAVLCGRTGVHRSHMHRRHRVYRCRMHKEATCCHFSTVSATK